MLLMIYIFFDFNIYRPIDILRLNNNGILLFLFFFLHRLIIETPLWHHHLLLHLMILSLR